MLHAGRSYDGVVGVHRMIANTHESARDNLDYRHAVKAST